jgi:hypothetical protein
LANRRLGKPGGIVDGRAEGDRHHRADPRHRHQPSADGIAPGQPQQLRVPPIELRAQPLAGPQHRVGDRHQHVVPGGQLAHPGGKPGARHLADFQPEPAQDAAEAQLDVEQLGLQQLARHQPGPHLRRRRRLGVHRPKPPHAQQLRDAARIPGLRRGRLLRSVLTIIADSAALTCRVSSRAAANPASLRPA